jgi:hypothetical protein
MNEEQRRILLKTKKDYELINMLWLIFLSVSLIGFIFSFSGTVGNVVFSLICLLVFTGLHNSQKAKINKIDYKLAEKKKVKKKRFKNKKEEYEQLAEWTEMDAYMQ